ncbi:hypothetical protein GCM10011374_36940 [Kocuria dechangensis]|uniref:DUF3311 domain-containing protein n=1 Tax=Kocuria dechangensis TaxID=1176249 RepID=A0A917M0C9_9MICC|nr:DUF3311 domain-containing protein [Kocuria dechangensis]GGG69136.1 hypothetical protein GCM10011374_36940 [Kocuria dechangensis]
MKPNPKSVLVALVLPIALMVAGVSLLGPSEARVLGVPAIFVYVVVLFPTVAGLMALAWNLWDKHESYDEEPAPQAVAR